ncbi:MAG: 16S rRNA (guanine(527)-N(7))-methyltransferase RsmG [Fibrobacteraceae bacterium]|nr:16S rRNA (guanine(527)-N(7))-methyltransferase RsmG [Fibrobacteraceae bacterium]
MKHFSDPGQENLLLDFLSSYQTFLPENALEKIFDYTETVIKENELTNLISRNDIPKFLTRHIADSLMPFIMLKKQNILKDGMVWADMGSGGGCPIFPLAIVCPAIKFFASEPRSKRVHFLQSTKTALHLDNLTVIGKRFETSQISRCDIISCRALSRFEEDFKRALPALKHPGFFITFKSKAIAQELQNIPDIQLIDYNLPLEPQQYSLVIKGIYG